jgi:ABC-type transport system involved in cytochrome c biogenesis permease subunit
MTVKLTIQGYLIYSGMALYFLAFIATLLRRRKAGPVLFGIGFLLGCIGIIYRWIHVEHVPMQNLFEVFLCLGTLVYPISLFCSRILRVGGTAADMLIGIIVFFPAGFVFSDQPQQLPPALQSWLFAPHVLAYMLSYILMTKATVQAVAQWTGDGQSGQMAQPEEAAYRMVCAGFPLLTLGLLLGSFWGQFAWGDWWGWDPKELWSLASWLVYVGYFHFRYMFGKRFSRLNALWVISGLICILITLLWVNLSKLFPGLHNYAG